MTRARHSLQLSWVRRHRDWADKPWRFLAEIPKSLIEGAATAADARTTLQAAAKAPFDLAILDLSLPDMPGATLLQRLQEIAPRMQFIVCTGYSPGSPQRNALPRGIPVLMKPWSREELIAAAERIKAKLPKLEPEVRARPLFP